MADGRNGGIGTFPARRQKARGVPRTFVHSYYISTFEKEPHLLFVPLPPLLASFKRLRDTLLPCHCAVNSRPDTAR